MSEQEKNKKRNREVISLKENEEVEYWKERCNKIERMRDESERDLLELRQLKVESDVLFEKKIKLLDQKITLTTEEIINLTKQTKQRNKNCENCQELMKQIQIYELLSGIKIKKEEENNYLCTIINKKKKIITFKILIDRLNEKNDSEVEYEPILIDNTFPEYLQSSLAFEKSMGPMLLSDLLSTLYPQDEEEGEGVEDDEEKGEE